jgi:hypothetical protein
MKILKIHVVKHCDEVNVENFLMYFFHFQKMDISFSDLCAIINKQPIENRYKAQLLQTMLMCLFDINNSQHNTISLHYKCSEDKDIHVYQHYNTKITTNIEPESISHLKPYLFQFIEEDRWNKYYDFEPSYNNNFKSVFHFGVFVFYARMIHNKTIDKNTLDNVVIGVVNRIEHLAHTERSYHLNNINYINYRRKYSDEINQIRAGLNDHLLRYDLQSDMLTLVEQRIELMDTVELRINDTLYSFAFGKTIQTIDKESAAHYHTTINEKNQFITVVIMNSK